MLGDFLKMRVSEFAGQRVRLWAMEGALKPCHSLQDAEPMRPSDPSTQSCTLISYRGRGWASPRPHGKQVRCSLVPPLVSRCLLPLFFLCIIATFLSDSVGG